VGGGGRHTVGTTVIATQKGTKTSVVDTDPYRFQGFKDQKFEKKIQLKMFKNLFLIKNYNLPSIKEVQAKGEVFSHRLNVELDLQSLFGLLCTAVLIGRDLVTSHPSPPTFGLIYEGAIGQSI
jgi:hypothetical protein